MQRDRRLFGNRRTSAARNGKHRHAKILGDQIKPILQVLIRLLLPIDQKEDMIMKTTLLTSTALVLSAGLAAAEVSIGGDGRLGVKSDKGADAVLTSRVRISFSASGESDNGLSFGGSVRADNSGGGSGGTAGNVFVSGPFGKVSFGDVDSAAKAAVGQAGSVGMTGLGDLNEIAYIKHGTDAGNLTDGKPTAIAPGALWEYSMGDLKLYGSAGNPDHMDDRALSGAIGYSIGTVGIGVGVERFGEQQHVAASVSAGLGDASVKLVFGSKDMGDGSDNMDQYGASASFATGAATFTAFTSNNTSDQDHFGIGVAYDLGGNAAIKGGFADGDGQDDASFDLGITMGF